MDSVIDNILKKDTKNTLTPEEIQEVNKSFSSIFLTKNKFGDKPCSLAFRPDNLNQKQILSLKTRLYKADMLAFYNLDKQTLNITWCDGVVDLVKFLFNSNSK